MWASLGQNGGQYMVKFCSMVKEWSKGGGYYYLSKAKELCDYVEIRLTGTTL
jgi:hypothetical protein